MTASVEDARANLAPPATVLWRGAERNFCQLGPDSSGDFSYAFVPASVGGERPTLESVRRLTHEFELRDQLDNTWAVRPRDLIRERGQLRLLVNYLGGAPLDQCIRAPMGIPDFLRLAISLTSAIGQMHARGLIHKDIKPANVLLDVSSGQVKLTGFGIASRLQRDRQSPEPPELIAGTLAYMAPEQTGRVNRSIDSRSDLYSLGVTLYELLTGTLPFNAVEPMEWVHCHIAKQPVQPSDKAVGVPASVSSIVMKLLSKTCEERYQTAAGVLNDLQRCLNDWEARGAIADFIIGAQDSPDRLMLPEKLYGRDGEVQTLLDAFDRVVAGGRPELVLVSGYSGIGKSAVVNELHKPLVPPRGIFASGKFDQYKRDIPYATLAQALENLVRPLLSANERDLAKWREVLSEALGPNGQLIVELVPAIKHIVGEQPPVPELPPQEAQRRFQLVFRRFIGAFARPEHPLALFLDDLQWLDAATLDFLDDLLARDDVHHLLLIGAYRDNEVSPTHPLMRKLTAMREGGAAIRDIVLSPLDQSDLSDLLCDSLRCSMAEASPLARLIHDKTSGNPFFAIQFISTLAEEQLLAFDYRSGRWTWDLGRIHAKGYTDNVVDLMIGKLSRLPASTQFALQRFACMGNTAAFDMLQMVFQDSTEKMHADLWEAVRNGLIFKSESTYRFLHDRVQEAAYSLIPLAKRAETHLRIGMLLATHTPLEKRDEAVFEIVNQLNRGSHLLTSWEERKTVAELNQLAGRRAKLSAAYESALKYLRAGSAMLSEATWTDNYTLKFAIEYLMAECELLTAELSAADGRLQQLAERAQSRHDFCIATRLRLTLYTALDRSDRAAEVFLEWLRRDGTVWNIHPTRDDVMREYERIWQLLAGRRIEDLFEMPLITDTNVLDTLDVFTEIVTPSLLFDEHLSSLVVCRMVNLSLEHGNCDGSCFCYVWLGMFAGPRFGNYVDGFKFAQLGYDLVEKRGLVRYQARTYMNIGCTVMPWVKHVGSGRELIRRAFDAAYRVGDLTFASYSWDQLVTNFLAVGDPLDETQRECENGLAFAMRVQFGLCIELCGAMLGLIMSMRGLTLTFGSLDHLDYTEVDTERRLTSNRNLIFAAFYYWTRKCEARFYAGDYLSAAEAALNADPLVWTSSAQFETAEHQLYGALAHGSAWDLASEERKTIHFEALQRHCAQLEVWAEHSPETFENRAAIARAEIARIEGRLIEAEDWYEKAIRSAQVNGFVHHEAFANELAARFYRKRGLEKIAMTYLKDSRRCYERWGADAKVRQLDELFPGLDAERPLTVGTATMQTSVEQLELATVIKVSEAVSGEIVLESLIQTLMRTALEYAGAERGMLILPRGEEYWIEAEATAESNQARVEVRDCPVSGSELPESVFRYVLRTKEGVLVQDAVNDREFGSDGYIRAHLAKSILCLPILKQTRFLGMLYLENKLAAGAFTPARTAILKLLSSEAAVSLENARLYKDLAGREARIRRLVDANIIGIVICDIEGTILEANDAFLRIVGYDRADLASPGLRWTDMTPPEWRERDQQQLVPELRMTGSLQPFEKEFFRKDGTRAPVLVGVANFEDGGQQGVAFVLDLTERKRAADALRGLQMELARANRLATMGQLTASISHEVNQPIGATRNNAHAALRFLAEDPPDLTEVREAIECVVKETYRAGEILGGIRDQVKKTPPRMESVDVKAAIGEVMALIRGELLKQEVPVEMRFAANLPPVRADRVQLQQVVLNLILNALEALSSVEKEARGVVISAETAAGRNLMVSVKDSGPGVALPDRERVFESFFTTKAGGVGIGLSICRSIIDSHGGRLWVDDGEPRGAVFRFTLPVYE